MTIFTKNLSRLFAGLVGLVSMAGTLLILPVVALAHEGEPLPPVPVESTVPVVSDSGSEPSNGGSGALIGVAGGVVLLGVGAVVLMKRRG
jgi:hypothetical protein